MQVSDGRALLVGRLITQQQSTNTNRLICTISRAGNSFWGWYFNYMYFQVFRYCCCCCCCFCVPTNIKLLASHLIIYSANVNTRHWVSDNNNSSICQRLISVRNSCNPSGSSASAYNSRPPGRIPLASGLTMWVVSGPGLRQTLSCNVKANDWNNVIRFVSNLWSTL